MIGLCKTFRIKASTLQFLKEYSSSYLPSAIRSALMFARRDAVESIFFFDLLITAANSLALRFLSPRVSMKVKFYMINSTGT